MKLKYIYEDDYVIVYNTNTMQMYRFKGNAKKTIPSILPENYSEKDKDFFVKEMNKIQDEQFRLYLLSMVDAYNMNFLENREIMTISFAPVHKCNMRCKYCFADGGENYQDEQKEMSEETLHKVFNFVFNQYAPDCKFIMVSLVSGGEPFLNLELIQKINHIIDCYKHDVKRKIFIGTNLTLYNDEIKEKLLEINPQLGVSIDGNKQMHNCNRVLLNGEGTYSMVSENIKKLKADSDLSPKTKNCIFMTVITEDNLDLVEILKHHKSLGASSVQMRVARSKIGNTQGINEANLEQFIKAYTELKFFFVEEFKEGRTDCLNMILNSADYFGKYIKRIMLQEMSKYRCGAGKDKLTFTANGDIYPCDSFVGNECFCLGNVFKNKKINEEFMDYSTMNNPSCSKCWARMICTGDCLFNSYARTGKVDLPDGVMCKFYRKLAELSIRLVNEMMVLDGERYNKLLRLLQIREKNNSIS